MPNAAKACSHHKYSMVGTSKLKTSQGICTKAIQNMSHMTKAAQNSPKACQNNAKTCVEYRQDKLV